MLDSRESIFYDDETSLMYRTLTANIRERRGSLVDIKVPIFVDKNTVLPEGTSAPLSNGHVGEPLYASPITLNAHVSVSAKPGPTDPYIKMDAMAFGMGCCCLQITFQAWNVNEARRVYDALVPVAPIMVRNPTSTCDQN